MPRLACSCIITLVLCMSVSGADDPPALGPTGNWYEVVIAPAIAWEGAKLAAEQRTLNGHPGHLATITSFEEDLFIEGLREQAVADQAGDELWIGGFQLPDQPTPGDGWFWINDEGPIPATNSGPGYAHWLPGEPNDCCQTGNLEDNEENYLHTGFANQFVWNDTTSSTLFNSIAGYVVEYPDSSCTLDLVAGYADGTLTLDFTLGAEEPTIWSAFMFLNGGIFPLWFRPLPPVDPPVSFSLPIRGFPQIGLVAFVTMLATPHEIACIDFAVANTRDESVIFADDFDPENGGSPTLNVPALGNWDITDGSVDLIGSGFFDFFPGNGLYLDLDGTTGNAARIETKTAFSLMKGRYELRFDLAGNQREGSDTVTVSLGGVFREDITLEGSRPMETFIRRVTIEDSATATIRFDHAGGDDIGILLFNVRLTRLGDILAVTNLPGDSSVLDRNR